MAQVIGLLVAWLSRVIVPLFGLSRFFGFFKSLLSFGLFTVGVPLAINWGLFKVASNFGPTALTSFGLTPRVIELTGLGAWMGTHLQLPLCISILMSFAFKGFVLRIMSTANPFNRFTTDRFSS